MYYHLLHLFILMAKWCWVLPIHTLGSEEAQTLDAGLAQDETHPSFSDCPIKVASFPSVSLPGWLRRILWHFEAKNLKSQGPLGNRSSTPLTQWHRPSPWMSSMKMELHPSCGCQIYPVAPEIWMKCFHQVSPLKSSTSCESFHVMSWFMSFHVISMIFESLQGPLSFRQGTSFRRPASPMLNEEDVRIGIPLPGRRGVL